MGYYTDYDFSKNPDEVIEAIEEISSYGDSAGGTYGGVKWYNHDEHMKSVSLMFPDKIIHLQGEGEERADLWRKAYLNGKVAISQPVITFTEFGEFK